MEYKLTYFNVKALGEPIRYILSYMGKEFEDNRIARDQFPKHKKDFPFGKVPSLQIGSEVYTDSVGICRYLAIEAGLAGATPKENLILDQMIGAVGDFLAEGRKVVRAENEEAREKAKDVLIKEIIPFYMERFEKIMKDNGGYLANGKLSWVDLYFTAWSETLTALSTVNLSQKYPHYRALKEKVQSLPGIKEYIQKRPETPF